MDTELIFTGALTTGGVMWISSGMWYTRSLRFSAGFELRPVTIKYLPRVAAVNGQMSL